MSRNPPWVRDELILALDLYFKGGQVQLSGSDEKVIQLSALLNSLPLHSEETRSENFRSPDSVSMKLGNFLSLDPDYEGAGLYQSSRRDQEIWQEFSGMFLLM